MPTIAELNVRIGATIKGLESGLKSAESALRKSDATLGALSSKLTNTISLAFAGIGVGALKSFGDIDKLTKGMEAQLGSAEAARSELEKIREAAKAPGLGFEQFVKGSIQLQAVGDSAAKARETISAFGNALALAGKGAAELDGVTVALTQIKAKGVVSAEEINQIAERLPQIRTAMKDAFGTANTEELQKLGISANQFVDGIVASLEKLPKATGGFTNDITNAFDNVKQGASKLGEAINSGLRVGERLTALSEWAISAADYFGRLDDNTQRWILGIGVAAAAIGPAIKAGSALVQVGGAIANTWTSMAITFQKWIVLSANPEAATGLISWWKGLNTVMKANIIGVTIGVVLALSAAFVLLRKDMSAAAQANRAVQDVSRQASDNIVEEKVRAEQLIGVLKDQTASREAQKKALGELKAISPEYFGRLDTEKSKIGDLDAALDGYVAGLLRAAKAQAAFEQIKQIEKDLNNLAESADPSIWQSIGDAFQAVGNSAAFAGRQAESFAKNTVDQKAILDAKKTALEAVIKANTDFGVVTKQSTDKTKDFGGAVGEAGKKAVALKEVLSDISGERSRQELLGAKDVVEEAQAIEGGLKKLLDAGFAPTSAAVVGLKTQLQGLFTGFKMPELPTQLPTLATPTSVASLDPTAPAPVEVDASQVEMYLSVAEQLGAVNTQLQDGFLKFGDAFRQASDIVNTDGTLMQGVFMGMGDAIASAAASGETSFAKLGVAAAGAAAKIIRAYIQQGVAAAVSKALSGIPFPFNIAAGAAAGGLAAALFTRLVGAVGIKGFAQGTNFAPGGLSLVGERGPELINLPRGSKVYPNPQTNAMLGSLGAPAIILSPSLEYSASGFRIMLNREERRFQRTNGGS